VAVSFDGLDDAAAFSTLDGERWTALPLASPDLLKIALK